MSSVTNLLRTTALLSIVTTVMSVTSWDTAPKSNKSSTLIKRLTQPGNGVVGGNFDNNQKRVFNSNIKIQTNSADGKITQTMLDNNDKQYHDFLNPNFHPQNTLKCPPCVCKNISSDSVSVFCKLCLITSIPQSFPVEILGIIIEDCGRLEVLDLSTLLVYTSLTHVKINTHSLVKVFSRSCLNVSSTMIDLNLQGNSISIVEENIFLVFPNLLNLSLSNNKIVNLTREMFNGLRRLRYLSVAYNYINFIANDTFDDMGNLVTLDISYNDIMYTGHELLLVRIFTPLKNLEQVYIHEMCRSYKYQCGSYPNKALQVLTNLKLLSIDGADRRGLGPEVKNHKHLRHLIIHYPKPYNFTDESYFDNVPFITTLEILFIETHISPKSFAKLKNLVNLTNSALKADNLCKVFSFIKYLLKSPLKYLTFKEINDPDTGCKELNAKQAVHLKSLKLIELDLSGNYLVYLSPDFIAMLPQTLKKIDLSRNGLSYRIFYSFDIFPKEMLEINLNDQIILGRDNKYINKQLISKTKFKSIKPESSPLHASAYSFEDHTVETREVLKYSLPPKLQVLRGDNVINLGKTIGDNLNAKSNYSLKIVTLAGNGFYEWAIGACTPSIEIADFSKNYAEYFNYNFFLNSNSLKYLFMSNNFFGPEFEEDKENLFFANMEQLIALDVSRNYISVIAPDYFKDLAKIQMLDISKNNLNMINISFTHMNRLTFLDFSSNSITLMSRQSRDGLDIIATDHQVYLDLTFNPLPCTCEGLELMKWMAFTNVYLLNKDFLVCRNEFNKVLEIGNIVQRVQTLQRQCASKTVIILTCVFSIIVFGILLLTSLMYRYRWKLRYLRSIALVKLLGSKPGAKNMIEYRFDAYIIYTDDTRRFVLRDCVRELEEKRGHRLCIEERDFLPGTYNVSNIVSGVQNSAKTVVMVTPEFYPGEYSEYSVKMALMEEIFMRRSVLFLCVCDPTDDKDLSHDLLTAMKQNNYIEYPPRDDVTDEIIDEFWNQFSRAMGRKDHEEI